MSVGDDEADPVELAERMVGLSERQVELPERQVELAERQVGSVERRVRLVERGDRLAERQVGLAGRQARLGGRRREASGRAVVQFEGETVRKIDVLHGMLEFIWMGRRRALPLGQRHPRAAPSHHPVDAMRRSIYILSLSLS